MSSNPQNPRLTITDACPFRSAYSPKPRVCLSFDENSRWTKQSAKDECDINQIMARYMKTGVLDFANKHQPQYADVAGIDFQSCLDQIQQATAMFMDLPSKLRERFNNDPGRFVDFVSDPDNLPEMRSLGLLNEATNPPNPVLIPTPSDQKKTP